jgi:AraC family transcriptional regulator
MSGDVIEYKKALKIPKDDVPMQSYIRNYPLHASSPLTVPTYSIWKDITIEHHLQPPAECDLCLPKHTICLLLRDCQTERRVNGGQLHCHQAQRGEVIVYPATSEHWVRWQEQAEFLLLFLDPDLVTRVLDELKSRTSVEMMASEQERDDPLLLQVVLALKAEIDDGMVASSSLYAESLTTTLAAHLLRHYTVWKPPSQGTGQTHPASTLRPVIEYIHDNLDQHLTLADLSQVAGMSPYHFARTFKRVTGVTPHRYVLAARVEQAKNLLLQGRLTLAEISSQVGFFDQSHFTRAFKQLVGVTPSTLLRQNSKNILE